MAPIIVFSRYFFTIRAYTRNKKDFVENDVAPMRLKSIDFWNHYEIINKNEF